MFSILAFVDFVTEQVTKAKLDSKSIGIVDIMDFTFFIFLIIVKLIDWKIIILTKYVIIIRKREKVASEH